MSLKNVISVKDLRVFSKWVTTNDSEPYNEWKRVTTNEKEWQQITMSDSDWQQVVQQMKTAQYTSKNGWLQKTDTLLQGMDGYN